MRSGENPHKYWEKALNIQEKELNIQRKERNAVTCVKGNLANLVAHDDGNLAVLISEMV